jgi:hypothetical protein
MNRAFSAGGFALSEYLGRCPGLDIECAPLALKTRIREAAAVLIAARTIFFTTAR